MSSQTSMTRPPFPEPEVPAFPGDLDNYLQFKKLAADWPEIPSQLLVVPHTNLDFLTPNRCEELLRNEVDVKKELDVSEVVKHVDDVLDITHNMLSLFIKHPDRNALTEEAERQKRTEELVAGVQRRRLGGTPSPRSSTFGRSGKSAMHDRAHSRQVSLESVFKRSGLATLPISDNELQPKSTTHSARSSVSRKTANSRSSTATITID